MTRLMDRPSTQAIAQARERFPRLHRRRRALLGLFTPVVICAALVFAAAVTVAQPLWITDDAMAPTLEAGTLVLYSSWNYAPARGDVVVSTVESPEGGMLVRRIIGLPGDRVSLDRTTGQVTVNGQDLGLGGYLDIGLIDTMEDLVVNFIGAVVFSVFGFLYVKNRGKKDSIISRFVPRRKSADRDYLRLVIDGGSRESHTNMRDTVIEQTFDCPDKLDA